MFQSLFKKLSLINEKGKVSYSRSMVIIAFTVINLKLLFSGVEIVDKIKLSDFSGVDYAAALAAIGALHVGNKTIKSKEDNK